MIAILLQARTGSSRYPKKIYEDINGKMMLYRCLESLKATKISHKIILCMPEYDRQGFEERFNCGEFKGAIDDRFGTYFGSANDLLDRYYHAALKYGIDLIVRVTGDCAFCGVTIDQMVSEYLKNGYNGFMSNNDLVSDCPFPDGADTEIFPFWMLVEAYKMAKEPVEREHVGPYMYRVGTQYNLYGFKNHRPNSKLTMKFRNFSFDTEEDKRLLIEICKNYDNIKLENSNMEDIHALDKALSMTNFQIRENVVR